MVALGNRAVRSPIPDADWCRRGGVGYHVPVRTLSRALRPSAAAPAVPRPAAAVAGALLLALAAAWLGARLPGSRVVSDLGAALAAAAAAGTAAYAARRREGRVGRGWTLLALSSGVWSLGQLSWSLRQLGEGVALPNDPATTGLVLLSTPLALAGLLLLPGARPDRAHGARVARVALDVLLVLTALGVATWALVVAPTLSAPGGRRMAQEWAFTYPVAGVLMLTVVVLVAARAGGPWLAPVLLVATGLALRTAGDLAVVGMLLRGRYTTGGPLDLLWLAGFALLAVGALVPPSRAAAKPRARLADRPGPARGLLPYLPVVVALLAPAVAGPGRQGSGLVVGGLAVVLLLLARQVLTALDNASFAAEETRLAYSDPLTGLGNRALLAAEVAGAQRRLRGGGRLSLLLLDLDGFKAVNDSLGHAAGDRLLVQLAERLCGAVGPQDVVARLGGDEFAVLVDEAAPGAGLRTARRVLDALSAPVDFEGRVVRVTASIGVVEQAARGPDDVLRDADVAMYAAKNAGKACVRLFEPAMRRAVLARAELEADLRHALDRGEFVVQYQPVVDLETREVTGAEALVRWRHPRRGLLPPGAFMPLAEETGLIGELDRWVLEEACRTAAGWQRLRPGVTVGVNVTADRFAHTDLVGAVADALADAGLPPHCLTLELTETALVADAEATISRLGALDALGVPVAIDDFGTGYSSLAYLHRLPASILKIDRSFVQGLGVNAESTALVRVILGLAETFGLRTVAEGVETESQRALLRALGCTSAQGYLFSPAVDVEDFEAMLNGPARGVGRARLRPLEPAEEAAEPVELPDLPEPAGAPGVEPTASGVGPARLRLLPGAAAGEPESAVPAAAVPDPTGDEPVAVEVVAPAAVQDGAVPAGQAAAAEDAPAGDAAAARTGQ
jgi:diguanylate cyclase (GGDEF)-like protein